MSSNSSSDERVDHSHYKHDDGRGGGGSLLWSMIIAVGIIALIIFAGWAVQFLVDIWHHRGYRTTRHRHRSKQSKPAPIDSKYSMISEPSLSLNPLFVASFNKNKMFKKLSFSFHWLAWFENVDFSRWECTNQQPASSRCERETGREASCRNKSLSECAWDRRWTRIQRQILHFVTFKQCASWIRGIKQEMVAQDDGDTMQSNKDHRTMTTRTNLFHAYTMKMKLSSKQNQFEASFKRKRDLYEYIDGVHMNGGLKVHVETLHGKKRRKEVWPQIK